MKRLWQNVKGFFIAIFGGEKKLEQFLAENADDAIDIVENVKAFVKDKRVLTLISFCPKYEKRAQDFLVKFEAALDEILTKLKLAKPCFELPEFIDRVKCLVETLKKMPEDERNKVYSQIGSEYLVIQSRAYTKNNAQISEKQARAIMELKLVERQAAASANSAVTA